MAWIYPETLGEGNIGRIFDKSTGSSAQNGYYFATYTNNALVVRINGGTILLSANNTITLNKRQMVAATFDSTGRKLYVNCVDVTLSGGTETALPPNVAGVVTAGNISGGTTATFDGYEDKFAMFTRVLSLAEIKDIYNRNCSHYGLPKI